MDNGLIELGRVRPHRLLDLLKHEQIPHIALTQEKKLDGGQVPCHLRTDNGNNSTANASVVAACITETSLSLAMAFRVTRLL